MKTTRLQDIAINIKFKLSALWISLMFCFVYGDFFTLFVPGHIQSLMDGNSGVGSTSPLKLLMFAILMTIPSLMIVLSLILKPTVNRVVNVITALFYAAIMLLIVVTTHNVWMSFYVFFGIVEVVITFLIIWHAWKWPGEIVED